MENQMSDVTRRDFVKVAGVVTAAASTTLPVWAVQEKRDPIKVGFIGCGGRGTGAANQALSANKDAVIWAMGDAFEDRLSSSMQSLVGEQGQRAEVPKERQFVGFDAFQKVIDSGVDMVILTTPPHFRPEHIEYAVNAKKHVFCEKPMAVDGTGVRSVMASAELAKKNDTNLMSGFCWRYNPALRATFKQIHNGAIGEIESYFATYYAAPLWTKPRKESWSDMEWQMRNWVHYDWLSGDHIVEQACHSVDKINWAMKNEAPISCTSVGGREMHEGVDRGNVYDHFGVAYEYADGKRMHLHCRQMPYCYNDNNDFITGSTGTCIVNGWTGTPEMTGSSNWKYTGEQGNMYQIEHNELQAAIRGDTPTINDGEFMAQSTLMAILGREAAYTGQRISFDEMLNSTTRLGPKEYAFGELAMPPVAEPGKTKLNR
jgi:myo-inositol 2-dehydrogenase / D-chiro-inositol 1-dehydrogenase